MLSDFSGNGAERSDSLLSFLSFWARRRISYYNSVLQKWDSSLRSEWHIALRMTHLPGQLLQGNIK